MQYLAVIYTWTGEKDLALEQVAATARIPSPLNYGELRLNPWWDTLRDDPRLKKIVASLAPVESDSLTTTMRCLARVGQKMIGDWDRKK